jgi:putative ABC transport system permease protein
MRTADLVRLATSNLRRNRTRTLLTLAGVAVGVGALLTLIGYGAGLQDNARGEFERLELYNTLRVTSRPDPFGGGAGAIAFQTREEEAESRPEVPVTDSLLRQLEALPGVLAAYPEVVFPVQVRSGERELVANAEAIPQSFARIEAYQPVEGRFFEQPTDTAILISASMAERLGFSPPTAAIGDTVDLVSASLDLRAIQASAAAFSMGLTTLPFRENVYRVRVVGLMEDDGQAVSSFLRVLLPLEYAGSLQKVTFFSTIDLLMRRSSSTEGYQAARVQLSDPDAHADVVAEIDKAGVYASSLRDQFAQLERLFAIIDLALAIVGLIALVVATLGIANTMLMSVMERRREIGVMKAVGGEEGLLQRLFLAESALVGLIGGVIGIGLGYAGMGVIQLVVSTYLESRSLPTLPVFSTSVPMVLGVVGVAILVSVVAGWVPARRASRVEPVEALRSL